MSEELLQRGLNKEPEKIGKWDFYNIGATSIKALKENNIIRNIDYGRVIERKKVDGIIVRQKEVIAIIENKTPKEFNTETKQNNAINQELAVAKKLGCPIIIATDTQHTIWVNVKTGQKILNKDKSEVTNNWNPTEVTTDSNLVKLIEKIIISIDENNNQIIPLKFVNPTDLAKQIWQDIWSVSGATPENCLYTFVELFIFKYLSDLKVLKTTNGFDFLMKMYTEDNTDDEVLQYYADTIRNKIKDLFPYNPIDNTTIINGTIFVSKDQNSVAGYSTVFKKVLTKFNDYGKLENINYDFKSQLFESFLKESISKKNWGQFFTPLKVIRSIEKMASSEIKEGAVICDPACGVGKFLLEPVKSKLSDLYQITDKEVIPKITIRGFDKGFDKDEQKTIILAKANMLIYFSDLIKENSHLTKEFSKLFNETFNLKTNSILGTLSEPVKDEYDLILTNPPYVTSGSSNLKEEISKDKELENYYTINGMGVEGLFMEWIIRALKPNGKAFVVVPDGLFNRKNDARLRAFIKNECFIDAIISLPLNTFFSTSKKTYILVITKKQKPKQIQTDPVFTYLVSEIGESRDNYRFDIDQDDLSEAVNQFNQFKGAKAYYQTDDNRCKVLSIDWFNDLDSWVIDNCWSKEEKIELGVLKQDEIIGVNELTSLMDEMSNTILSFKEEIQSENEKKNEVIYKDFLIYSIFDIKRGVSKYTKNYGNQNKGEFPVYSASNNNPLTCIDTYDYSGNFLTWATNGFAGYVKIIDGKFSINADRALLIAKNKNTNIEYVKYRLEPILRDLAKGRIGDNRTDEFTKVYPSMLKNIKIFLPVNSDGEIDIEHQNKVAKQIKLIDELKTKVKEYQQYIKNVKINIRDDYKYKKISVLKLFGSNGIKKGLSKYTNTYIQKHNGDYPLYSSKTINNGIIGYIDSFDFDTKCITWTTDGIHAGTVFLRKEKFSMTTHCGALILNNNLEGICLEYVLNYLKNSLKSYAVGEQNKRVTVDIIKKVIVKIPIDSNDNFDINKQKEIAEKYQKIEDIKQAISDELYKIQNSIVEL
ncbi:Type I restriction-modification system, DNA-methyltransferase subunit M (EC 2.1.1.72) [uncultured Gammaproteobacteria bacterium]|nr:Type I restriction-modification system, DNA-methyltransferase subunit M (EC 2.1.1.72) [uncultured Gammaproteobacteria bacterium]